MTTIAYRAGVLAADTLATVNTHRDGYVTKIAKAGPFLACGTGVWPIVVSFLDWFRAGLPEGREPKMEYSKEEGAVCHVFAPSGMILTFSNLGWSWRRAPYYATGSGGDYCYGAMAMGASAEEAVRAALVHETASGGEVQTLRHTDG